MDEPGWISFSEAASTVAMHLCSDLEDASRRIRDACAQNRIYSMKAPFEKVGASQISILPIESWSKISFTDWRNRKVDFDGPDEDGCNTIIMLREIQFTNWLEESRALQMGISFPPPKPQRRAPTQRKRQAAKLAIEALWPLGIPDDIENPIIEKNVGDWLKNNGKSVPSRDTILRAADRKSSN